MPGAEATFRGQLVIVRMKGLQTILGAWCTQCMLDSVYDVLGVCCTPCMLYSVYAVLCVCCTQCQLMMIASTDRVG